MATRDPLLTPRQVSDWTGYAIGTLRNWRSQRRGPDFIGSGPGVRYRQSAVEAWLQSQTTKTA